MDSEARDQYVSKAADLIIREFDDQADGAISIAQTKEISNVDLVSDSLIAHRDIHGEIKKSIHERSDKIAKMISGLAYFLEQEGIKSSDEAFSKIKDASPTRAVTTKIENLEKSQEKIRLSFSSLSTLIDVFSVAMKKISEETALPLEKGHASAMKRANLYLKHAIIVYELSSFVFNYLSSFGLSGVDDLRKIHRDVMTDIKAQVRELDIRDAKLRNSADDFAPAMLDKNKKKRVIFSEIERQWDEILDKISSTEKSVGDAKGLLGTLELIRDDARSDMATLNIIATTATVKNTIKSIGDLSAKIKQYAPPPLDEKLAVELLALDVSV